LRFVSFTTACAGPGIGRNRRLCGRYQRSGSLGVVVSQHPQLRQGLFFKPTSNDGCMVHVSKYSVPKQGKFDLVLKLKNVCNGKAECVLSTDADLTERMLSLKSGEEQTVEMVKGAPTDRFEPRIRCRFE
jgi:hypothetical protein